MDLRDLLERPDIPPDAREVIRAFLNDSETGGADPRSADELRQSQEQVRTILNAIPNGVLVVEAASGVIVDANEAAARMVGSPREDLMGCAVSDWVVGDVPSLDDGVLHPSECTLLTAEGAEVPVLRTASSVTLAGLPHRLEGLTDIREHKSVEDELARSKDYLQTLLRAIPVGILVVDPVSGVIADVNRAASDMIGEPHLDIVGNLHSDYIECVQAPPEDRPASEVEGRLRTADDAETPVLCSLRSVAAGGAEQSLLCFVDIRAQKETEAELRRRQAILEAIAVASESFLEPGPWIERIPEVLRRIGEAAGVSRCYLCRNTPGGGPSVGAEVVASWAEPGAPQRTAAAPEMRFTFADVGLERWADMLSLGVLVCGDIAEFPDCERAVLESRDLLSTAVMPINVLGEWWGMIGFDACERPRAWSALEIDALKTSASLISTAIEADLSEQALRESEARFMDVFYSTPDPVLMIADGRVIDCNESLARLMEAPNRAAMLGRTPAELSPPFQPDGARSDVKAEEMLQVAAQRGMHRFEWVHRKASGATFPAEVTITPIVLHGRPVSYSVVRDITERLRAEEERKRLEREVQDAQRLESLAMLVAGVAHEINTPIGVGVTAASELTDRIAECRRLYDEGKLGHAGLTEFLEKSERLGKVLLSSLTRGANLVRSFKQVSADQSSQQRRVFNLRTYIDEVLLTLEPRLKKTRHEVIVDCPDDVVMDSYPGAVSQILSNLVINSLIHAYEDGIAGRMTISVSVEAGEIVLRFSDDGKGIAPEDLGRIFDPFFTTGRGRGGTGLGLHVVHNLAVQTLGGGIACESELGVGTTFIVRLGAVHDIAGKQRGHP